MIGQTVSRYRIVEKLGGGGMGVVYKAEDTKLGRFVALKFLPESVAQDRKAVERFMFEARAAAALSHPHICTIHEIDEHEGLPFIAMEYLEGRNLKHAIGGKPMALELVIETGIQVAEALAAAHAKGITHRDVKPSNVFITQGGQIKVVDFGLAKLAPQVASGSEDETIVAEAPTQTADLTDAGSAMGTVSYMSPEQALGQDVDARSDLFSLGAVLYEMITGRMAFTGSTQAAIFDKILNREPLTPARLGVEVPYELEQVLAKALEKNKLLRYQSALELHTDLRRIRRDMESGRAAAVVVADEAAPGAAEPFSGQAFVATPSGGTGAVAAPSGSAAVPATQPLSGSVAVPAAAPASHRTLWLLSGLLAIALIAIAVLLVQRARTPALAASDVLLLTDFSNTTGDPVFDGTLKQALAVKLEESPYLNIFPERQVHETLRFMGRETTASVTPELGQEICERQGIKAMVNGEIALLGSSYVVTLNAVECVTGRSLARQQVEANDKESVLAAVGDAAVRMRRGLGESLASIEKFDAPVEQATTSSLEALRALSLGEETRVRGQEPDAIPMFKRALELDPDFAIAHARLGTIYGNLQEWDEAIEHKTRAFELRDRVDQKERFYITSHYHATVTRELSKLIDSYQLYKQTYPRDWTPANNLASEYDAIGWYHKASEEAELALELNPDHPLPYGNLASAYLHLNRIEDAKAVLDRAFAKEFESVFLQAKRYEVAYLEGDHETMRAILDVVAGRPRESELLILEAKATAARGRLTAARELGQRAVESAQANGFQDKSAGLMAQAAFWSAAFGQYEEAAAQAAAAIETARNRDSMPIAAIAFALAGDTARAEELIDGMIREFPADTIMRSVWIPAAGAAVALRREEPDAVIELLVKAAPYERAFLEVIYARGLAQLMAGRGEEAGNEFQKLIELRGVDPTRPVHSLAHLGLARAHAAAGDIEASRQEYESFFGLLADADDGLPVLETARRDYAALP